MLNPVAVSLFPSCFDALAWSPDGELAVAAGDHIQLLTSNVGATSTPQGKGKWHITRIRVNTFTNAEWAAIYPQDRDDFSIATEQSTSTVLGLAWSPPGLAQFRRSVLAILTSNLILSLWEPIGLQGKWTRVGIVNHALHPDPSAPTQISGQELRKANIRSFRWCSPLHAPAPSKGSNSMPDPESRWGVHLLAVATDANEAVLLRARRSTGVQAPFTYHVEKLALHPLEKKGGQFPQACPGSLFQARLQSQVRISSISCGPWLSSPASTKGSVHSATASVAVVYGSQLRILKTTVALRRSNSQAEGALRYEATAELEDHPLARFDFQWAHHHISGPLEWAYTDQPTAITLAVGVNSGVLTISIPRTVYSGSQTKKDKVEIQEWPLSDPTDTENGNLPRRHLDPITFMTALRDEQTDACVLHLGTVGGLSAAISLNQVGTNEAQQMPPWGKSVEDRREQYDLDRDLGGQTVARMWGLSSYRGVTAVLFTIHPTDMIEYRVNSDERATIAFAFEDSEHEPGVQALLAPTAASQESRSAPGQREAVINFLLHESDWDESNAENQKLIYTAACCATVDKQSEAVRSRARQSFERLAALTGADLSEEISKCSLTSPTFSAKSTDQLTQPGGHLFEQCNICDAGIAWFSAKEAQCANGHLFARCGLTFLAIQEPGKSKYCSLCRTEYFDEELVARMQDGHLGQMFRRVCEAFDTCLYCGGKFQASL